MFDFQFTSNQRRDKFLMPVLFAYLNSVKFDVSLMSFQLQLPTG